MTNARLVLLGLLTLAGGVLHAQTVAEDILKGKEIQGIVFKSYVGPHSVVETRAAIQGIGADLGRQIKTSGTEADYAAKYHVLRVHDATAAKLSADILILAPNAGVDDIRNLNWIVSAYLQQAFGYSQTDGDLLADFVTRYNAFYRGKMDYIAATFIPQVGSNVTAENAGIALDYTEWPGKTRLLIPLRDSLSKGLSGSVNTEEISNKDITSKMATEPGAGVDQRKKLADLKEGEIVQEQKAIAQAEAKVNAPSAGTPPGPTATASPAAAAPTPKPSTAPAVAAATPAPAASPAPSAPAPSATPPPAMPLEKAKQDLAARDQALQTERKDIVKTEQSQPAATPAPAAAKAPPTTPFVVMTDSSKLGQVWLIDTAANKVWKKSDLNSVRQPQAPAFGTGLLVVAGDAKAATGAVRLVLLSKDDASVTVTGTDDVSPDTPVVIIGNLVYALTKGAGGWVLGSFDASLKSVAKGTDALSALTAVVQTPGGLLVQSSSGQVLTLDSQTLKKKAGMAN